MREVIIRRFEEGWGIEMVGVAQDGRVFTIKRHPCKSYDEEDKLWTTIRLDVEGIRRRLSNDPE